VARRRARRGRTGARQGGQTGWPDGGGWTGVARRGGETEGQTGPDGGQTGWLDGGAQTGWPDGGGQTGPDGARRGPNGEPDRSRRSARRVRRGGERKDYLLLKEKMTCSV
jgi:hypothetical protein